VNAVCLSLSSSESSVAHRLDALVPSRMQPQLLQGLRAFVAADISSSNSNNSSNSSRSRTSSGNAVRRVWGRRLAQQQQQQQQQQQGDREHSSSSFGDNLSQWSEPSARQYTHYSSDAEPLWDDASYTNTAAATSPAATAGTAAATAAGGGRAHSRTTSSSNGHSLNSNSISKSNYDLVAWESVKAEKNRRGRGASPPLPPSVASAPALQYEITLYIQMALCRGLTLQQWLQRRNARVAAAAVAARAHAAKCCSASSTTAATTTGTDAASVTGSESSRSPLLPPPPWPEQCAGSSTADSCADSCSDSCTASTTTGATAATAGTGHLPLDSQRSLRSTLAARAVRNSANAAAAAAASNSSSCNGHSYAATSSSAPQQCNGSSNSYNSTCSSSSSSSDELQQTSQQSSAACPHCGYAQQETEVDLTEAVIILKALASGLVHVHARSIIHRDLKPENVFILPDGCSVKIGEYLNV
jgi:Protein kinase domain